MKSQDVECPYCGEWQEINHDDGMGYEENIDHQQECSDCGKIFIFTTGVIYTYDASPAPCLNEGEHNWEKMHGAPKAYFHGRYRCSYCGEEEDRDPEGRKKAMDEYTDYLDKKFSATKLI